MCLYRHRTLQEYISSGVNRGWHLGFAEGGGGERLLLSLYPSHSVDCSVDGQESAWWLGVQLPEALLSSQPGNLGRASLSVP